MAANPSWMRKFFGCGSGRIGVLGLLLLAVPAVYAPFIANGRPLVVSGGVASDCTFNGTAARNRVHVLAGGLVSGGVAQSKPVVSNAGVIRDLIMRSFPFLRHFFAPDSQEAFVDVLFNYLALLIPVALVVMLVLRRRRRLRWWCVVIAAVVLLIPFAVAKPRMDKRDYRDIAAKGQGRYIFAPIPYGPFEPVGTPYAPPDRRHVLGCDEVGRDVAVRMIYGARTSLAVGILATALALSIGATVGIAAGYFRGWFDLGVMRLVEILMCFPTFLLLLILMSSLGDRDFGQSIPIVIAVLGLTGWIGIAFLVRGETLKQCALPYIQSCEVSGLPTWRIMFRHLLPNISPVLLTSGVFGIAGAILAENGLSFLGFGIQPPGASWGDLLRQAFANPLDYWHLTLFPGAAIFVAVISFNFIGDAIGKALAPK